MFQYLKREICDDVLSQKGLYIPKAFVQEYSWTFERREYKKASVSEAYVGPCQLCMMDLFAKIVKDFSPLTISAKIFPSHRMFDRVLNKPLHNLSNSFILENCFILSFSIISPFHMRARSRNIYIMDRSLWRKLALTHSRKRQLQLCGLTVFPTALDSCRIEGRLYIYINIYILYIYIYIYIIYIYLQTARTYTPPVAERNQLTTNDTISLIINAIIS